MRDEYAVTFLQNAIDYLVNAAPLQPVNITELVRSAKRLEGCMSNTEMERRLYEAYDALKDEYDRESMEALIREVIGAECERKHKEEENK